MINRLLETLQQKRIDQLSTFDIKISPVSFTVIVELYQSKGERFKDFKHAHLETALQDAIDYIDLNILYK